MRMESMAFVITNNDRYLMQMLSTSTGSNDIKDFSDPLISTPSSTSAGAKRSRHINVNAHFDRDEIEDDKLKGIVTYFTRSIFPH